MSQNQCQTFIKNKCALFFDRNGAMKRRKKKGILFYLHSNKCACDYYNVRRAYRVNKPPPLIVVLLLLL
jgi:hypothetical protein